MADQASMRPGRSAGESDTMAATGMLGLETAAVRSGMRRPGCSATTTTMGW